MPRTFTAIAFDSGGVASGPLTATFMLPFAMGACEALGGNVMTDAFGPCRAGCDDAADYRAGHGRDLRHQIPAGAEKEPALPDFGDNEIIELWEAC